MAITKTQRSQIIDLLRDSSLGDSQIAAHVRSVSPGTVTVMRAHLTMLMNPNVDQAAAPLGREELRCLLGAIHSAVQWQHHIAAESETHPAFELFAREAKEKADKFEALRVRLEALLASDEPDWTTT